jgi:CTP:molybdopterin cytidylyltransferase MocA
MIVIPMAGESRRFLSAGYQQPKYMLTVDGRPLFDWTVLSFKHFFLRDHFLFIARDTNGTAEFLSQRIAALGILHAHIVLLPGPTGGQAETVEHGLDLNRVSVEEPLFIFNIDTIRPNIPDPVMAGMAGLIEVFRAPGDHWSFVEPSGCGNARVLRCAEKKRISDLCCTGLYAFASVKLFRMALAAERKKPSSHELFVAPLFNHLISWGNEIGWYEVPAADVILSGVPVEYEALCARPGEVAARFM